MPEVEELTCRTLAGLLGHQEMVLYINTGKNPDYVEKVWRPVSDEAVVPMVEMMPDETEDCKGISATYPEHDKALVIFKGEVVKKLEPTGNYEEDVKALMEEVTSA